MKWFLNPIKRFVHQNILCRSIFLLADLCYLGGDKINSIFQYSQDLSLTIGILAKVSNYLNKIPIEVFVCIRYFLILCLLNIDRIIISISECSRLVKLIPNNNNKLYFKVLISPQINSNISNLKRVIHWINMWAWYRLQNFKTPFAPLKLEKGANTQTMSAGKE